MSNITNPKPRRRHDAFVAVAVVVANVVVGYILSAAQETAHGWKARAYATMTKAPWSLVHMILLGLPTVILVTGAVWSARSTSSRRRWNITLASALTGFAVSVAYGVVV